MAFLMSVANIFNSFLTSKFDRVVVLLITAIILYRLTGRIQQHIFE